MTLIFKLGHLLKIDPKGYKFKCTYSSAVVSLSLFCILGMFFGGAILLEILPFIFKILTNPRTLIVIGALAIVGFLMTLFNRMLEYPGLVKLFSGSLALILITSLVGFNCLSDNVVLMGIFNSLFVIVALGIINLKYQVVDLMLTKYCDPF